MTEMMPEQPIGNEKTALSDPENVQLERLPDEEQDSESLEYAYALLARSPLPAVATDDVV